MNPDWRQVLEKALGEERISPAEAIALYRDAPLRPLGRAATARRAGRTDASTVTYLIDRNINYTNVCVTVCRFCAFWRPAGHEEAYTLSREELGRKIEETLAIGGTRILMQGGHHPDLPIAWYEDLLAWIRETYREIEVDAFSPSEIDQIASIEGISTLETLGRLEAAGLSGLPGGGAEMLDDEIRSRVSPKKQSAAGWLQVMREAQSLGLATTCTQVIGFGESVPQRLGHLQRLRDLQEESLEAHGNGFIAFIAWTLQTENTPLRGAAPTRNEYLRHVAVSRIFLDNIDHIQASWPTQGPRVARTALRFGADDFGSTMLEENVVSSAGTTLVAMSEEEIRAEIRRAGFTPAQRNTRYEKRGHVPNSAEEGSPDVKGVLQ